MKIIVCIWKVKHNSNKLEVVERKKRDKESKDKEREREREWGCQVYLGNAHYIYVIFNVSGRNTKEQSQVSQ